MYAPDSNVHAYMYMCSDIGTWIVHVYIIHIHVQLTLTAASCNGLTTGGFSGELQEEEHCHEY